MVALLLASLAAAAQAAPPGPPPTRACSLVTPAGDNVGFWAIQGDTSGEEIGLVAAEGSLWPPRTIPGRRTMLDPAPGAERRFALGGTDGVVLEFGERDGRDQPVTLFRREGRRSGLPLAYGFCQPARAPDMFRAMDPAANPRAIGAEIAAFNPETWPEQDCALLTRDGRRLRFSYRLRDAQRVEIAGADVWGDRRVTAARRQGTVRRGRPSTSSFGRRGGPSGFETFFVQENPARAVKLISFRELGASSGSSDTGFAICGYNALTRRAAPQ